MRSRQTSTAEEGASDLTRMFRLPVVSPAGLVWDFYFLGEREPGPTSARVREAYNFMSGRDAFPPQPLYDSVSGSLITDDSR
jgi:hypothetical protein